MSIASEISRITNAVHGSSSISSGAGSVANSIEQTVKNWGLTVSNYKVDTIAEALHAVTKHGTASASTASTISTQNGTYTIPAGYHTGNESVLASITAGAYAASVSTKPTVTPSIGGEITSITSTTKPSGTAGTDYWTIDPGGSVTTTGKAMAEITAAGYLATGDKTADITPTVAAGTNYYLSKGSSSLGGGGLSTNMTTETFSDYYVTRAAVSNTQTAGYMTGGTASTLGATTTYIKASSTGSAETNTTATATVTLDPGKQVTIGAGYYGSDRIIRATVADAAGEAVASDGYSLAVTDNTTAVTVDSLSSGVYPITTSLTGTLSASTAGWFTSGTATASSVRVGTMAPAALGTPTASVSNGSATLASNGITTSTTAGTGYNANYYITVNTTAGSATPSATVSTAGYAPTTLSKTGAATTVPVNGNGSKLYVPVLEAATITPGTSDKTIAAGKYIIGTQTIKGVSLTGATAANILTGTTIAITSNGETITSIPGTMVDRGKVTPAALNCGESYTIPQGYHNGTGVVTAASLASQTSATATIDDILSGKTAWVNGSKITGSLTVSNYYTGNTTPDNSLGTDGDFYFMI